MPLISKYRLCIPSIAFVLFCVSTCSAQSFFNLAPSLGINHSVNTDMSIGGSGTCFFDFDNDGWDDITFVQVDDSILFYRNLGGSFQLLPSFIYSPGETKQLLWVDYDNDGDNDAFLVPFQQTCRLYQNDGNFNFTDVTSQAGLSGLNTTNHGVSFADYNKDGYLDFYLARYSQTGDPLNTSLTNVLFKNNGDGTFTDVTEQAGVADGIQPSFIGVWMDVNENGWPDLYVINDRLLWGNTLFLNNTDGTFTNITEMSGVGMFGEDPMCASFSDFDNDGDLDILCSNGGPPTKPIRVYVNQGDTTFVEQGQELGIDVNVTFHCTWGASWIDVDNDSFQDLYIATGLLTSNGSNEIRSYLFMSDSANQFIDSPEGFVGSDHIAASYGVAKGDVNNDGFADIVVQNAKEFDSFIWRNMAPTWGVNNYLKVTLEGTVSNTMAIGSWIRVYANGEQYSHYTRCGESFVSQDSQHHIFGLGSAQSVDSVLVEYSLGHIDRYYNLNVNQQLYLTEGETIEVEVTALGGLPVCAQNSVILDAGEWSDYLWNTGHTGQFLTVDEPGDYWVQVTNQFGIVATSDTLSIEFFETPEIEYDLNNPLCYNDQNGTIQLFNLSGGVASEVTWSNGMSGTEIQGLGAGEYFYVYTDENGCTAEGSVFLQNPFPLSVQVFTLPEVSGEDGAINLIINGGTPPYQITLNGDSVAIDIENLTAGIYSLLVLDDNGCTFETEVTIELASSMGQVERPWVHIFPNPVYSGHALTLWHNTMAPHAQLYVQDISGKVFLNRIVALQPEQPVLIKSLQVPTGIYIVRLLSEEEIIFTGKLLVK